MPLTTVGYGGKIPVTAIGRIFAAIVVLIGVGIIAVPTGLISAALTRSQTTPDEEPQDG